MKFRDIDSIIADSLKALAADPHVTGWLAREDNWVSYFAFRYLVRHCQPGSLLSDPAQIGVEVSVPQPPNREKKVVKRDTVIWSKAGMTCWDDGWSPSSHPLAILEWKVHRPGHRNPLVAKERAWLRDYCRWQPSVVAYAIEVDGTEQLPMIRCFRFPANDEQSPWLEMRCGRHRQGTDVR
jgi:hypothetical protein